MLDRALHEQQAALIRLAMVELLYSSGDRHFGGSLSLIDLLRVIWRDYLALESKVRDRFALSKGHGAPALYCVMHALGLLKPRTVIVIEDHMRTDGLADLVEAQTGRVPDLWFERRDHRPVGDIDAVRQWGGINAASISGAVREQLRR